MVQHLLIESGTPVADPFFGHDPRINYFNKGDSFQNFGDFLPPLMAKELLLQAKVEADIYRLVGSVIEEGWIRRDLRHTIGTEAGRVAFWGCGMRSADALSPEVRAKSLFFGVRGPLTRDALGLPDGTPLGDPGLLAPLFHQPSPAPETLGRAICIPHIHDTRGDDELLGLSGAEVLVRPSVAGTEDGLRGILDKIASASFVLSNSLHGAIIAAAYRRPFAYWKNGHLDVPFKWDDFSGSAGIPSLFMERVQDGREVYADVIAPRLVLPPLAPILDICPFAVRPSALLRAFVQDGILNESDVAAILAALDRLPSLDIMAVRQVQQVSEAYREARTAFGDLARRRLGRGKEAVKLAIRTALKIQ